MRISPAAVYKGARVLEMMALAARRREERQDARIAQAGKGDTRATLFIPTLRPRKRARRIPYPSPTSWKALTSFLFVARPSHGAPRFSLYLLLPRAYPRILRADTSTVSGSRHTLTQKYTWRCLAKSTGYLRGGVGGTIALARAMALPPPPPA